MITDHLFLNRGRIIRQLLGFSLAVLSIVLMTLLLYPARDELNTSTIALLYLIPVLFSTTLWGLVPGVLSSFLAFLAFNYFFLQPYHTFTVHNTQDLVALFIFFVVSVVISQLVGRTRSSLAAAVARENETIYLYQLSLELAGVNSLTEVASVIAHKTAGILQTAYLELHLQPGSGRADFLLSLPDEGEITGKPDVVIPIETVRASLGEIRLWLGGRTLTPTEERLVKAFAAQGGLALERVALANAETQAKILEESDRFKSIILSSVSHEFRTPLSTIKAATTSLLSDDIPWESSTRTDLLTAVDEEADYLNYLVGNLLDMSRIEAGALQPKKQWNFLIEIVGSVLERMRRMMADFRLEIEIDDDFPLIPVDYYQMEQVFTNLLNNSVKYAPKGSAIHISAKVQDPATALIKITNEGPQVNPEHLNRIFDKFFRVTAPEKVSGTGLGLSICKGIIEAHGGQIWAENIPGGLAFVFTLPLLLDGNPPPRFEAEI
jgi:two-component system sensor histidine kinase KdpD